MIVLFLVLFIAVAIGAFALMFGMDQRSEQARILRERLEAVDQAASRNPSEELALLRDDLVSAIPALNKLLSKSAKVSSLQRYLSQAQLKVRAGKFLLISASIGAVLMLATTLLLRSLILPPIAFVIGASVPFLYASFMRARRFHAFEAKFPEAVELLARAVRAGHAFTTALELIATEMGEPIGGEFRKVFEEQKFGLPLRDALFNLTERVPLMDVKFFVTAILLQRETGGNLAEILDKLAYLIRERFKILRQVKVYTAQGRLTMGILMVIPPGLVAALSLISPAFMAPLLHDPTGHILIAIALTMQTIGFFLIRRIIDIKV
jgi:tight adherence protein B